MYHVSFQLQPAGRRFQPLPSLVVIILIASDPLLAIVHNSLLSDVTSGPKLSVFRNCLKTYLFSRSIPSFFWLSSVHHV